MRIAAPGLVLGLVIAGGMVTGADAQQSSAPQTAPAQTPAAADAPAAAIEVPAGTKVLLALHSGIDTKSAQPGDSVYLASTFPVVVDNRVAIPAGVYVQGVIDKVVRPGRVHGRAEVQMHFTTIIFPNGSVVSIPGVINALPGSTDARVKNDEGAVEKSSGAHIDPGAVATGAATGAGVGTLAGAAADHPFSGLGYGALAGAAGGALYSLFTHNNDLTLEQGQTVEMVLQRPLKLDAANLAGITGPGPVPSPESDLQRPMARPARSHMLCPLGTLGCV
uniref:TrbI/VirB10 family protein n=1 Tax=Paracidobacterium acidisoli TaxID=2303751 RepID=A0A372IKD0_9BACT